MTFCGVQIALQCDRAFVSRHDIIEGVVSMRRYIKGLFEGEGGWMVWWCPVVMQPLRVQPTCLPRHFQEIPIEFEVPLDLEAVHIALHQ